MWATCGRHVGKGPNGTGRVDIMLQLLHKRGGNKCKITGVNIYCRCMDNNDDLPGKLQTGSLA